jgi:mycofactocin biosynthetic radical S-adenosylmethionine protein MftC
MTLVDQLKSGLDAPICLTWELTYACNLACIHCLSSSGRRDPRELSTAECKAVIDELARLQVFYVNIGGGEPTIRPDFFELITYCVDNGVGVKFSTNGSQIDEAAATRLSGTDYIDIQISLDGADRETNDAIRGSGSWDMAIRAMDNLAAANLEVDKAKTSGVHGGVPRGKTSGVHGGVPRGKTSGVHGGVPRGKFKISVVITRHNVDQLDAFEALANKYGAELRLTRLRPAGRGADTWDQLHPTNAQQRTLYNWLIQRPNVLTGDSFFHLSALGESLPGLNLCGAGRIVCLIDPVGDVYACPFVIHDEFRAGNVRDDGGFSHVWKASDLFLELRGPQSAGACASCGSFDACQGGCMAAKFFTGLPLDGPDPECVFGNADEELARIAASTAAKAAKPIPSPDHSKPVKINLGKKPVRV